MRVGIVALAVCLILALGVWGVFHLQVLISGSPQDAFVSWLVDRFGMLGVTMWAISFFSTIPERVLLFFFCSVALGATFVLAHPLRSPIVRFLLPVGAAFFIFLGLYTAFHRGRPIAVAVSLALIVGITQWPSWKQTRERQARGGIRFAAFLPAVILAPALGALLLDGGLGSERRWNLISLAQRLHADKAVQQVATIDLNGVEVDADRGLLFTNGHGTNHLLAYNLRALDQAPRKSEAEVGFAQGFAYNRSDRELCVFNSMSRSLLVLDAMTLALKKLVTGLNLSEGDCFIEFDKHTGAIFISAEARWPARKPGPNDDPTASPITVVERTTGRQAYALQWCDGGFCNPGHILLHGSGRLLYMGFIDRILAYDTGTRRVIARTQVGDRWIGDHLALTPDQDEVLYPSPLHSAVLRFDAQTLEFKGRIPTVFGVRNLTVDPVRNLLLTVSGLTNTLDVIDLKTRKRVAKYYIAPWLRTIALDAKVGIAYVSSAMGLFKVDYKAGL